MKFWITCIISLSFSFLEASKLDMRVSYGRFFSSTDQSVLETYYVFLGSSLNLQPNDDGLPQGAIRVEMGFYQNDSLAGMHAFLIRTPAGGDFNQYFTHTERVGIKPGMYELNIIITDFHNEKETHNFTLNINLLGPDKAGLSDAQILASIEKANEKSTTSRAGYELTPYVPKHTFTFTDEIPKLQFYSELYNRTTEEDSIYPFMVKYFIEKAEEPGPLPKLAGFQRIDRTTEVTPILKSFDLSELPSGNYFFVIELVSQKNKIMDAQSVYFQKIIPQDNEALSFSESSWSDISKQLAGSFVELYINEDSIVDFVDFLHPIADFSERRAIEHLTEEGNKDKLKLFFYSFWTKKNPLQAYEQWLDYYTEVRHVNKVYGMRVMPGYQTDRGRIYLQYGPPSLVEDRRFETGTYPFEIWQYDQLKSNSTRDQVDRIFVFVDREVNTNRYRLVHSTAQGERFNEFWVRELTPGNQMGEMFESEDMMQRRNELQRRGDWGSRAIDNMIINPSSMGRYGRW